MAKPREWARLPSAEGLLFRREPEEIHAAFFAVWANLFWEEPEPAGRVAKQKTECRWATGMPRTGARGKAGIETARRGWREAANQRFPWRCRLPIADNHRCSRAQKKPPGDLQCTDGEPILGGAFW